MRISPQSLFFTILLICFQVSARAATEHPFGALHSAGASPSSGMPAETSGLSGMFFDPEHEGEGFVIDVFAPGEAAVYWFTYDAQGRQRWFLGVAEIDANGMTVDEWTVTRGARFGDEFDPADVEYGVAGSARFDISGCDRMSVAYTIDGVSGSQELVRLASVADLGCSSVRDYRSGVSGSYFDPAREGEGIVLHVYDQDRVAAVFFTYDDDGEQMWVLGVGSMAGDTLTLVDPFTTSGGNFGPEFDPERVEYQDWGALTVSLDCDNASVAWTPFDPGLGNGGSQMQRLTRLTGLQCDEGAVFELQALRCGDHSRSLLTAVQLGQSLSLGMVDNKAFAPDQSCQAAHSPFEASITFPQQAMSSSRELNTGDRQFPEVEVAFTTVGDYLIPVQPELHWPQAFSNWQIVFSEGRVWSEPADGEWSRAALPFTLSNFQWNQAHHGLMTFLYTQDAMSPVHLQIVQENLPWDAAWNAWATLAATFGPGDSAEAYAAERAFRRDLATRLDVRGWEELGALVGPGTLVDFNRSTSTQSVSQAGIALDDTLYLQPAYTRAGNHPYPESMRHGAFSVSKTAGAAVAMLRLAQKFGAGVFDERIADHIEVTAAHNGWDQVTFGHALSMVTGIGDGFPTASANVTFADEADESNPHWLAFNYSLWLDDRLEGAFSFGNYPWGPGEVMRYNSAHTMILAVAMDNYLKSREGPDADLWRMLNEEVYQPMGIRWFPSMRLRIDGLTPGPVPMGWGLLPNPHDVVRVARLLQAGGAWKGEQLLHAAKTREALRLNADPAWHTARQVQYQGLGQSGVGYRDGIWSAAATVSGSCNQIASYMEGVGGNFVVMMPSGVTLFRFADGNSYDVGGLLLTGERIRSTCP